MYRSTWDVPTYVELTKSKLIMGKKECKWLTQKKFTELKNFAQKETLYLPVTARVPHTGQSK